ncbi:MAG TPA: hypothetical protein VFP84_08215 [Kofleriaceae bacterium]|nr:hypothetical protein [Kofleriaceae bacterium]
MRSWSIPIFCAVALGACGGNNGGKDPGSFSRIVVDPPDATLSLALGGQVTQPYHVLGYHGSTKIDITTECELSVSDPTFGTFTNGTITISAHGGTSEIDALCGEVQATPGQLTVNLSGSIVDPSAPPDAGTKFGGATLNPDPAKAPVVEYPIDGAVSPRNIPPIEVQWKAAGNDLFHVALTSSHGAIDVYTANVQQTLAAKDWAAVAGTAAGETLKITVEGMVAADPTQKYATGATNLTMSVDNVDQTAIYYWASSAGSIMNQVFGDPSPPKEVKGGCTSCHTVSRTGSRIGYSRCVGSDCQYIGFLKYDGVNQVWNEVINADNKTLPGSYTAFAPLGKPFTSDDKAVALATMNDGTLKLLDPDTGGEVASNIAVAAHDAGGQPTRKAMMADWSSDGNTIAFVQADSTNGVDLSGGKIATMTYDFVAGKHQFGEPHQLVPSSITLSNGTYTNFFFPTFSPDNALIAFNAARLGWRNLSAGQGATPGQRLMITDVNGKWVQDLTALNGGMVDGNVTWAHWAPAASTDYYWIVFSSERDYGHEVTRTHTNSKCVQNGVLQCKQIWIAAIAKDKVAAALADPAAAIDPSRPPMWLPGQDPNTDNISPYWSVPPGLQ